MNDSATQGSRLAAAKKTRLLLLKSKPNVLALFISKVAPELRGMVLVRVEDAL